MHPSIGKSAFAKSADKHNKRNDRFTLVIGKGAKKLNNIEISAQEVNSTDFESSSPLDYYRKSTNMKESIAGLLKLLVIQNKNQDQKTNKSKRLMVNCTKEDFITMKDVQYAKSLE